MKVTSKKGIICITNEYGWDYDIELDRIDTPSKILSWVHHLCGKTWITPSVIEEFIQVATMHINQDIKVPA